MTTHSALTGQTASRQAAWDALKLMRIPFSYFLTPVFFFALSQAHDVVPGRAIVCFIVLHLFIYPASNGYNSYMDQDEGSIGGLKHPPRATRKLFYLSLLFDTAGLAVSLCVSIPFCISVLAYVLASRAYSYRGIRLKKYPLAGFLTIVAFQGAFTFLMVYNGVNKTPLAMNATTALVLAACVCLIGGFYPLTQVYQHEADRKSGDVTISSVLGYTGTFVFSAIMFLCSATLLFFYFYLCRQTNSFLLFLLFTLPVVGYFAWWFIKVAKNHSAASYENTMNMNLVASTCLNLCFITFLVINGTL